jgi:hypothetical protein
MGEEITRARFPNRKAGVAEVSRGSQRKKAQQRDQGEKVTVESPQVSNPSKKYAAGKHKPTIKGKSVDLNQL